MHLLLTLGLACASVAAQNVIVAASSICPDGQLTIITRTSNLGSSVVAKVSCVVLDTSVKLDFTVTPATIRAISSGGGATTPVWKIQLVSLTSLAAGSASISITTAKPPTSGAILFWYSAGPRNVWFSGVYEFTANPFVFPLPPNWSSSDTIMLCYQTQ